MTNLLRKAAGIKAMMMILRGLTYGEAQGMLHRREERLTKAIAEGLPEWAVAQLAVDERSAGIAARYLGWRAATEARKARAQ